MRLIQLPPDKVKWPALVNMVTQVQVPYITFLTLYPVKRNGQLKVQGCVTSWSLVKEHIALILTVSEANKQQAAFLARLISRL